MVIFHYHFSAEGGVRPSQGYQEEIHHLLIHALQTALIQRNPHQGRGITLRCRLPAGQLLYRPFIEVLFSDQMAVLNNQQPAEGRQFSRIEI